MRHLIPLACILALASCKGPLDGFCPEPVFADSCTKTWLETLDPPACAQDYFSRIGIQQGVIKRECKGK